MIGGLGHSAIKCTFAGSANTQKLVFLSSGVSSLVFSYSGSPDSSFHTQIDQVFGFPRLAAEISVSSAFGAG